MPAPRLYCQVKNRSALIGRTTIPACLKVPVTDSKELEVRPNATRQFCIAWHLDRLNEGLGRLGPLSDVAGRLPVNHFHRIAQHRKTRPLGRDEVVPSMHQIRSPYEWNLVVAYEDRERSMQLQYALVNDRGHIPSKKLVAHTRRTSIDNRGRTEILFNDEVRTGLWNEMPPRTRDRT